MGLAGRIRGIFSLDARNCDERSREKEGRHASSLFPPSVLSESSIFRSTALSSFFLYVRLPNLALLLLQISTDLTNLVSQPTPEPFSRRTSMNESHRLVDLDSSNQPPTSPNRNRNEARGSRGTPPTPLMEPNSTRSTRGRRRRRRLCPRRSRPRLLQIPRTRTRSSRRSTLGTLRVGRFWEMMGRSTISLS